MNVLFLSELLFPHGGGAEFATYLWAKLLAASGFRVRVITNRFRSEPERSEELNLEIIRLPIFQDLTGTKYSVLARADLLLSSLVNRLLTWADVVYVPRFWFSAIPVAKAHGKTVITHLHDYIPICAIATKYDMSRNCVCDSRNYCNPSCIVAHEKNHGKSARQILGSSLLGLAVWPSVRRLIQLSDAVVCVSKAQRDIITSHMPSLAEKSHTIYNPLPDVEQLDIAGTDLGYYGGPEPLKGFNSLCRALRSVKTKVTIHATKFEGWGNTQIRFPNGSRLLTYGVVRNLDEIYARIHAVVVPSIWQEPAPYVVPEAMLRGRLLIASRLGGIPEQVDDSPGAFLCEGNDPEALAELIDYACTLDKQSMRSLASRNRATILSRFNNEATLRAFTSLLDNAQSR
jgi:glycosyltransferase involved in cell wall biosynthesis